MSIIYLKRYHDTQQTIEPSKKQKSISSSTSITGLATSKISFPPTIPLTDYSFSYPAAAQLITPLQDFLTIESHLHKLTQDLTENETGINHSYEQLLTKAHNHETGKGGTPVNLPLAFHTYEWLVEANYAPAKIVMAKHLLNGTCGIHIDSSRAALLINEALKQELSEQQKGVAFWLLGLAYKMGYNEGGKWIQDSNLAMGFYGASSRRSNIFGRFCFAAILFDQGDTDKSIGITQNYISLLFTLARNENNAIAQHYLGMYYEKGLGGDIDLDEALKWYSLSVKQEFAASQCSLGTYYLLKNNLTSASSLLQKAVDQGYEAANRPLEIVKKKIAAASKKS
jgi:TPR repeat protein